MKIICIGRNYVDHAHELGNAVPEEPVFFLKPDTALLLKNTPFFLPDFSNEVHHEIELVIKICRLGKNIEPRFASKYYQEFTLGIDFTARDIQNQLKAKGLPWEKAKAFDGSAFVGQRWLKVEDHNDLRQINFSLKKNKQLIQSGNTKDMLFGVDEIIANVSKYMTLKIGDLIFTGTPAGVGSVMIGDVLEGQLGNEKVFELKIK